MIEWFRSWHGAPTDNKWLVIARRANTSPGIVSAVVWALLDHASQAEQRGSVESFDIETYAAFSGFPEDTVRAVIVALTEKGLIKPDFMLSSWEKRQPKREDNSAARVAAHRAVKRGVTHGNAVKHPETLEERREDKRREEEERASARILPLKLVFPKDGTIEFTRWADLCRSNCSGKDVDYIASEFRKFCHGRGIEWDDPHIEKTFSSFCRSNAKRIANA